MMEEEKEEEEEEDEEEEGEVGADGMWHFGRLGRGIR
jgi:hypothetical protein